MAMSARQAIASDRAEKRTEMTADCLLFPRREERRFSALFADLFARSRASVPCVLPRFGDSRSLPMRKDLTVYVRAAEQWESYGVRGAIATGTDPDPEAIAAALAHARQNDRDSTDDINRTKKAPPALRRFFSEGLDGGLPT